MLPRPASTVIPTMRLTIFHKKWEPVMRMINRARLMLRKSHSRVYIIITVDDRKGAKNRLTGKIQSIERRLRREVRK